MSAEAPLFVHWYDFTRWLLNKTEKFPKKIRFSLSNRIDNLALDIMEGIIEARYSREKKDVLRRVDLNIQKLQVLLRMCHDRQHLDHKGYEFASRNINEGGKMVGGWRKQQEKTGE